MSRRARGRPWPHEERGDERSRKLRVGVGLLEPFLKIHCFIWSGNELRRGRFFSRHVVAGDARDGLAGNALRVSHGFELPKLRASSAVSGRQAPFAKSPSARDPIF